MRTVRPPRWRAVADIQGLIRSFPAGRIVVYRPTTREYTRYLQREVNEASVFDGEALFIPAGGDVKRFGLGQVEEENPRILIPGHYDIRQGDMVRHMVMLPGGAGFEPPRVYRVKYAPDPWWSFKLVQLDQYQQGT